MTVKIELPPEIEAELLAKARAQGLEMPRYVERVLREQIPLRVGWMLSPAQRAEAWRQSARSLPRTQPLADESISRETTYSDRGR
jgi:hypothetical protein